jgi:hypothetical protein
MTKRKTPGLRSRVASALADLDPTRRGRRSRGKGVTGAADEIRKRFLGGESSRTIGGRKAATTRKRNQAKRSTAAKKGARTRAKARS